MSKELRAALEPILQAIAKSGKVEAMDRHNILAALRASTDAAPVACAVCGRSEGYHEHAPFNENHHEFAHPAPAEPVGLREQIRSGLLAWANVTPDMSMSNAMIRDVTDYIMRQPTTLTRTDGKVPSLLNDLSEARSQGGSHV